MNTKNSIRCSTDNTMNDPSIQSSKKDSDIKGLYKNSSSNESESNNEKITISINKTIKSAFKKALENEGIDIMEPTNFIEAIYSYLPEEKKGEPIDQCKSRISIFVKSFIFFLVNWNFSLLEQTFDVNEIFLKTLMKKQLFKCYYLQLHPVEAYKMKSNLQERNYHIIYNIIKLLEYKKKMNIIGINEDQDKKKDNTYSLVQKFNWFIKFIDYIILCYLSKDCIIPFSVFFNNLEIKKVIDKFDAERNFDLNYFFSQMKGDLFAKKIVFVVETIIYYLIKD